MTLVHEFHELTFATSSGYAPANLKDVWEVRS